MPVGPKLLVLIVLAYAASSRASDLAGVAYFETHIRPALVNHCYECHSGDEPKGDLRLDYRGGWQKGGKSGPALVTRKPDESLLLKYLRHEDPKKRMPKGADRLHSDVVNNFIGWINKGAPDPRNTPPSAAEAARDSWRAKLAERSQWWSLQPPRNAKPPPISNRRWKHNPVDRFIFNRLKKSDLSPASPATAEVLLRRLSFVLTGLPPKPEQIDPFCKAYAKNPGHALAALADELLASPHYGERIARHWMDVVRYTDTYGYEWDNIAVGSWEYRDYLIRAFNDDIGYDRLVREQIAGDLLPKPRINHQQQINESLIGPMFYHLGEHRHGASVNFNGIHQEMVDNKIDAFSKTFLAMTVACARCHDHKLDAISQKDYYALAGIFMTPRWTTRPVDSKERNAKQIAALKKLRSEIHDELKQLWQNSNHLQPSALRTWAQNNYSILASAKTGEAGHPMAKLTGQNSYTPITPTKAVSANATLTLEEDGQTARLSGDIPKTDIYTIEFETEPGTFNGLRLEALTHPSFGKGGPGLTQHGNFVLSTITVAITPKDGKTRSIKLVSAEADYNQPNYHIRGALDSNARGWGVGLGGNVDRTAWFAFQPIKLSERGHWKVSLQFRLGSSHILGRFRLAIGTPGAGKLSDAEVSRIWSRLAKDWKQSHAANVKANGDFESITDLSKPGLPRDWVIDGKGLEHGHVKHGTPRINLSGEGPIAEFLPAGYHTHALSPRLPGALRLPDPKLLAHKNISIRFAAGDWTSRRIVPQNAFLAEGPKYFDGKAPASWLRITGGIYRHGVTRFVNEFTTATLNANFPGRTSIARYGKTRLPDKDEDPNKPSWFSLTGIAGHTNATVPKPTLEEFKGLYDARQPASAEDAWKQLSTWLRAIVNRWAEDDATAGDVVILNWLHEKELLPKHSPKLAELVKSYRETERQISWPRTVNSMDERHIEPVNYRLNIRGDVYQEGDAIRRNFLEVFKNQHHVLDSKGSGRLELAEHLANNPLTARVFVNRVWHWIFGTGIVDTPSDFGKLGGIPTHPELLDWLTHNFIENGWSTKKLIRQLVLSQTFRQSGRSSLAAKELDPRNRLLHHYPTRRLEAEAIRDSLLAVSGRLDPQLYGKSINPYRRAEDSKKRLFSGPLDGNGRRSLYQEMSIMQPPEFLVAFNLPDMKLPSGKRDVTNVPAQALTMLNDPFVNAMAEHWAEKLMTDRNTDRRTRTHAMFRAALGRNPKAHELDRWTASEDSKQAWQSLAHALFNTKEFIYYR